MTNNSYIEMKELESNKDHTLYQVIDHQTGITKLCVNEICTRCSADDVDDEDDETSKVKATVKDIISSQPLPGVALLQDMVNQIMTFTQANEFSPIYFGVHTDLRESCIRAYQLEEYDRELTLEILQKSYLPQVLRLFAKVKRKGAKVNVAADITTFHNLQVLLANPMLRQDLEYHM